MKVQMAIRGSEAGTYIEEDACFTREMRELKIETCWPGGAKLELLLDRAACEKLAQVIADMLAAFPTEKRIVGHD